MRDARRILVLAPHADDEVLGCGGTLALRTACGAEVHIVVTFDGAAGDPRGHFEAEDYVACREGEARRGGAHLGLLSYEFWRLSEGHTPRDEELRRFLPKLEAVVDDFAPDLILAPWGGESHTDHASLARAVELWMLAQDDAEASCEVWGFEVWSDLAPELLVDVSAVWEQKLAALREHATQLEYRDLLAWSERRALRHGSGRVEAFRRLDNKLLQEVKR